METNSRPEATASPVKQGQYSPRKRKDTTPKVNPQLAVEWKKAANLRCL